MIFLLQHTTYDGSWEYYFEGPEGATQETFKGLCDKLLRMAAQDILAGRPLHSDIAGCLIGYDSLVREVSLRLPYHGYTRVELPTAEYVHGMIFSGEEDNKDGVFPPHFYAALVEFNRKAMP